MMEANAAGYELKSACSRRDATVVEAAADGSEDVVIL